MTTDSLFDKKFDDLKKEANNDVKINVADLGRSASENPKLYVKYLDKLSTEVVQLDKLEREKARLYKSRWSYYMGHAPEEEYKKSPLREKIQKADINKYIDADPLMLEMSARIDRQKVLVRYLEDVIKAIKDRQFSIKAAIDWQKFQSGA